MAEVELRKAYKRYGDAEVIHGVDMKLPSGEFIVFVGPSGCGKSTLLRMIAGLEQVSEGSIHIKGQDVTDVEAVDRGIAMVFQSYALYPHMTVAENMGFGLRMGGAPKQEVAQKVAKAAKTLQLEQLLDRKPKNLSGGQRQRVAIGRAIVRNPDVFLFDEPLSNLDAELRVEMRLRMNFVQCVLRECNSTHALVELPGGTMASIPVDADRGVPGSHVTLGIRPEDAGTDVGEFQLSLKVDVAERLGGSTYLYGACAGVEQFVVQRPGLEPTRHGETIDLQVAASVCYLFDDNGEAYHRTTAIGRQDAA